MEAEGDKGEEEEGDRQGRQLNSMAQSGGEQERERQRKRDREEREEAGGRARGIGETEMAGIKGLNK